MELRRKRDLTMVVYPKLASFGLPGIFWNCGTLGYRKKIPLSEEAGKEKSLSLW